MFTQGLQKSAKEYLHETETVKRSRSQKELTNAGPGAVPPLIDALSNRLREASQLSWGKKEIEDFLKAAIDAGVLRGQYIDMARKDLRNRPEDTEGGMSPAQINVSIEATQLVWRVVSSIGEAGIRELFKLINGRDRLRRLTSFLVLNIEGQPSRFIMNLLYTSVPYVETISSEQRADRLVRATDFLILRMLYRSGSGLAYEHARESVNALGIPDSEIDLESVLAAIETIASSRA